jgi:hypothetical protein
MVNGLKREKTHRPALRKRPKKPENISAIKTPINGEAINPDIPVSGCSFHEMVDAPNRLRTPITRENGMIEKVLPNISILKMVPVVRRFILISSTTISLPLIVVEDPND